MLILLLALAFPQTAYGPCVESARTVSIGESREGHWWARGIVEERGTLLVVWTSPDGRQAYGQYHRNRESLDGCWGWVEDCEFDDGGCLGGDVYQETIWVRP